MNRKDAIDFTDTETAFAYKSDRALKRGAQVFSLMNHPTLIDIMSWLGIRAVRLGLPFARAVIRQTLYKQFVGGVSLSDLEEVIAALKAHRCFAILDYAAEGKNKPAEFDQATEQFVKTIDFAAGTDSVPVISVKLSALTANGILEQWGEPAERKADFEEEFEKVYERLDRICARAASGGVGIFIDAEESWYQGAIDYLATDMMARYNKEKVIVYNTFQLYRKDRLDFLRENITEAQKKGYLLGAKLVRGAYMNQERERAAEKGHPDPIWPDKAGTDRAYNAALHFCAERYESVALCAATHNMISCRLLADIVRDLPAKRNHPHLNFCQLYGMGDDLTFNLAAAGYNVAKYLPYGPVREVLPYLVRRADENKAMAHEFNREYRLIKSEIERRKKHKI